MIELVAGTVPMYDPVITLNSTIAQLYQMYPDAMITTWPEFIFWCSLCTMAPIAGQLIGKYRHKIIKKIKDLTQKG
ncbi:MAG: hypothetical protein A4E28_00009 [Methanocella sp. PtaU1.Bin125]|nr:MAG: hypothetical protein A4E28_00009 [Methanocella sp. PtaU1.Bin125]